MARRSEQGNILGFVLVGVVLTALLLGGVYMVRHLSATGKNGGRSTTAGSNSKTSNSSTQSTTQSKKTTDSSAKNEQQLRDALAAQNAAEDKAKQQQAASSSSSSPTSTSATGDGTATSNLPTTGPEDGIAAIVGVALLAGSTLAYTRSRRII